MRQLRSVTLSSALSVVLFATTALVAQQPAQKPPPAAPAGRRAGRGEGREAGQHDEVCDIERWNQDRVPTRMALAPQLCCCTGRAKRGTEWHRIDYIKRLAPNFTVIGVDLRGNGESDKPTKVEAYAIDRLMEDLLAVADAAGAQRFHVWGFAYGGMVGR